MAETEEPQAWAGGLCWDYPELDATDGAHPAWWRGQEYGVNGAAERIKQVLDGNDDGAGVFGSAGLEEVRRQILDLLSELKSLKSQFPTEAPSEH